MLCHEAYLSKFIYADSDSVNITGTKKNSHHPFPIHFLSSLKFHDIECCVDNVRNRAFLLTSCACSNMKAFAPHFWFSSLLNILKYASIACRTVSPNPSTLHMSSEFNQFLAVCYFFLLIYIHMHVSCMSRGWKEYLSS
ncbi:hypothetical protein ACKWTF_005844 [Chironomus riparius]